MKKLLLICILSVTSTLLFAQIGTYYNANVRLSQTPAVPILDGNAFNELSYKISFEYSNNSKPINSAKLVFRKHNNVWMQFQSIVSSYPYTEYADSLVFDINSTTNQFRDSIGFNIYSSAFGNTADIFTTATLYIDSTNTSSFIKLAKDSLTQYYEGWFNLAGPGVPVYTYPDSIADNLKNWYRSFGGSKVDSTTDLVAVNDSTSILIGNSKSLNGDLNTITDTTSSFVIKYNKDGGLIWKTILTGDKLDKVLYARSLLNGDIIILGEATSVTGSFATNHGMKDLWLTKIGTNGNVLWQKLIGGSKQEYAAGIKLSKSNEIYIAAHTFSNDGNVSGLPGTDTLPHLWMLKVDAAGNIINQKVFKDSLDIYNYNAFEILDNGQLAVVASGKTYNTTSNEYIHYAYTIKLDSNFNQIGFNQINRGLLANIKINAITKTKNDGYVMVGAAWSSNYYTGISGVGLGYSMHWGGIDLVFYAVGNGMQTGGGGRIFYGGAWDDEGYDIKVINDTFYIAGKTSGVQDLSFYPEVYGYHLPPDGVRRSDGWVIKLQGGNGIFTDIVTQKTFGGSGSDEVVKIALNNDKSLLIAGNTDTYNNGDVYDSKGATDAFLVKYAAPNIISGKVYIDANSNNQFDAGEILWKTGIVKSASATTSAVSNINNGLYFNSVDTGTFITKPILGNSYYSIAPNPDTLTTFTNFLETKTIDFALQAIPNITDLKISMLLISQARPGFGSVYKIIGENAGSSIIANGNIKFIKDNRTTFDSASVLQNSIVADTITWSYTNFNPFETKEIYVYLKLAAPPTLNISDTIKCTGIINPVASDTTPLNNKTIVSNIVRGSFDPNDKSEIHSGKLTPQQLTDGEYMTYIIRFQNTGTDTAFKVSVRDTLDSKLDWNSIQMISASHPYTMLIKNGNKIEWKFDPVFLPDSNVNEAKSHGYLAFRIKAKSNLTQGDIIKNNAAIYFDFNTPVATNTVQTAFGTLAPLPISLVSFAGVEKNKAIVLSWQTTTEVNTKYFEVEKSINGISFTKLETVYAKGNGSTISNYSVNDNQPNSGYNYYRLKIVDDDGSFKYSYVITINISGSVSMVISPNPVNYKATVAVNGQVKGFVAVNLLDINGCVIKNIFSGNINTNSFSIPLDVNTLSKGLYFVEILHDAKKFLVQKLVVQ
jgi:uncharacterized repeat protein (TIGR01451 family)